jgi:hypothetical protein
MPTTPRHRRGRAAAAGAALVFVFAATWILLDRTDRGPGWLTIEAPPFARVGQEFEVRVMLDRSVAEAKLDCSLHRTNASRKGGNYLASSGPALSAIGGGSYTFVFKVPEHEGMAFVFALAYLSPNGKWEDGTRAATTKHIPVRRDGAAGEVSGAKPIRVYHYPTFTEAAAAQAAGTRPRPQPSVWVHPVLAFLLLAAAAFSVVKAGRYRAGSEPEGTKERAIWLVFAAVLALSAVLELSGLAGHLAAWGRRLAEERNVYDIRKPFQEGFMAAVAAGSLGLFFLFIRAVRRPGSHRFLWWAGIGLAAYLAVSFVSVLSFHAVDVARRIAWQGISPVDAVRGAGVVVTLAAAVLGLRGEGGRGPI